MLKDRRNAKLKVLKMSLRGLTEHRSGSKTPAIIYTAYMKQHIFPFRSQHWDLDSWQELGFSSREDVEYWQGSTCGVLCLGMILEKRGKMHTTSELIKHGQGINAYSHTNGWSHDGLVELAQKLGLNAKRYEKLQHPQIITF